MPGKEANVQHNSVRQQEHDQIPGQILQRLEGKRGMQWDTDNKGSPRARDINPLTTTYHWI